VKLRVLIVEDNVALRTGLELELRKREYEVVGAGDGATALRLAREAKPDLVLLDLMLPRLNGYDVCRRLRELNMNVPILILTARTADEDELLSFQVGADDFVRKPFKVDTLAARMQALLHRASAAPAAPQVAFGDCVIDVQAKTLRRGGEPVPLTPREYGLLEYMTLNAGRVLSREQILDRVWGLDYEGTDRTVDRFVTVLRQKIEKDTRRPAHLLTVRTFGYKFEP